MPFPIDRARLQKGLLPLSVALLAVVFLVVLVRTAWVCDDAYITLRTVDNLVNGRGLTWNPGERVQAFTHPLWMLLVSAAYAPTRDPFGTLIGLSLGVSAIAVAMLLLAARRASACLPLLLLTLLLSKGFVDYSTSGLENPLAHLLLASFLLVARQPGRLLPAAMLAFLAGTNRIDALVLFLPLLAGSFWRGFLGGKRLSLVVVAAIAAMPLLGWLAFSTFYFGFPFPNTAYAKLATGISHAALARQGLTYLADTLSRDPVTFVVLVLGTVAPILRAPRRPASTIACLLALAYVVWVGGDFMSGRFLTPIFLLAAFELARFAGSLRPLHQGVVGIGIATIGLLAPNPSVTSGPGYGSQYASSLDVIRKGIADERAYWYGCAGLLSDRRDAGPVDCGRSPKAEAWKKHGDRVVMETGIGFVGYFAGPTVHIIDPPALADPLLARLRTPLRKNWRIGHFHRALPPGYLETVSTGVNHIRSPRVAAYYDLLVLAIRGPLLSAERFRAILALNSGSSNLKGYWVPASSGSLMASSLPADLEEGRTCLDRGSHAILYKIDLHVVLGSLHHEEAFEIGLNDSTAYVIGLRREADTVARRSIPLGEKPSGEVVTHCIRVPQAAAAGGYDALDLTLQAGETGCVRSLAFVARCGDEVSPQPARGVEDGIRR